MNADRFLLRTFSLAPAVFAALVSSSARAGDAAAAEQLFLEGKRLMQAAKWSEACQKLDESQRIDPAIGTEFNLADCNERLGKTATAWAQFVDVAALAKTAGQNARETVARERARLLEGKLVKLTITVQGRAENVEVRRDEFIVGKAQWGVPMPIDPGEHLITARAPGKKDWEKRINVVNELKSPSVEVPLLEPVPVPVATTAPAPFVPARASVEKKPIQVTRIESDQGDAQRIAGAVVAAAGVVSLGVGTAFGILSKRDHDDGLAYCSGSVCDSTGVSMRDDARTKGNIATGAFIAGGALVAGGAILYFTAPKKEVTTTGVRALPMVGVNQASVALEGRW